MRRLFYVLGLFFALSGVAVAQTCPVNSTDE